MAINKKATAVALGAGALVLGAGVSVASLAQAQPSASPSASPPTSASPGQAPDGRGFSGRHGGRDGVGGPDFAKQLASKLGVTEAKVTAALQAIHDARESAKPSTAPTPGTRPDPATRDAALAKALASKLGVSEAKVTSALAELRAARQADEAAALKTRLDAAVKAGTLTQAEADAVTKAVQKGVIEAH